MSDAVARRPSRPGREGQEIDTVRDRMSRTAFQQHWPFVANPDDKVDGCVWTRLLWRRHPAAGRPGHPPHEILRWIDRQVRLCLREVKFDVHNVPVRQSLTNSTDTHSRQKTLIRPQRAPIQAPMAWNGRVFPEQPDAIRFYTPW